MRHFETLLKLLFLLGGIFLIASRWTESAWFTAFLTVNLLLGVVLMLNDRSPSYRYPANYPKAGKVLAMRKFEGALLILFAMYMLIIIHG